MRITFYSSATLLLAVTFSWHVPNIDAATSVGGVASTWIAADPATPLAVTSATKKLMAKKQFLVEIEETDWRITVRAENDKPGRAMVYSFSRGESYEVIVGSIEATAPSTTKLRHVASAAKVANGQIVELDADPIYSTLRAIFTPWTKSVSNKSTRSVAGVPLREGYYFGIHGSQVKLGGSDLTISSNIHFVTSGWVSHSGNIERWPTPFESGFTNVSIVFLPNSVATGNSFTATVRDLVRLKDASIAVSDSVIHEFHITNIVKIAGQFNSLPEVHGAVRVNDRRFDNLPGAVTNLAYTIESNRWYKVNDPKLIDLLTMESGNLRKQSTSQEVALTWFVAIVVISSLALGTLFLRLKKNA